MTGPGPLKHVDIRIVWLLMAILFVFLVNPWGLVGKRRGAGGPATHATAADVRDGEGDPDSFDQDQGDARFLPAIKAKVQPGKAARASRSGGAASKTPGPDASGRYEPLHPDRAQGMLARGSTIDPAVLRTAFLEPSRTSCLNGEGTEYLDSRERGPLTFDGESWISTARRRIR